MTKVLTTLFAVSGCKNDVEFILGCYKTWLNTTTTIEFKQTITKENTF